MRNNVFGQTIIAEVAYLPNASGVAIRASDSGRSDRPDLFNVDIVDNVLNGELIKGCELPDEMAYCLEATVPLSPLTPHRLRAPSSPGPREAWITRRQRPPSTPRSQTLSPSAGWTPPAGLCAAEKVHRFGQRLPPSRRAIDAAGNPYPIPTTCIWTGRGLMDQARADLSFAISGCGPSCCPYSPTWLEGGLSAVHIH